jgi:hypothetical protein
MDIHEELIIIIGKSETKELHRDIIRQKLNVTRQSIDESILWLATFGFIKIDKTGCYIRLSRKLSKIWDCIMNDDSL